MSSRSSMQVGMGGLQLKSCTSRVAQSWGSRGRSNAVAQAELGIPIVA